MEVCRQTDLFGMAQGRGRARDKLSALPFTSSKTWHGGSPMRASRLRFCQRLTCSDGPPCDHNAPRGVTRP